MASGCFIASCQVFLTSAVLVPVMARMPFLGRGSTRA